MQEKDTKETFAAAGEGFKTGLVEECGASNHWQE